jgi:hypothetical protein
MLQNVFCLKIPLCHVTGPPQLYPPPIITPKISFQIIPKWVFRQAQRFGKYPEALFKVSKKKFFGSRSKKPVADIKVFFTCCLNKTSQRPETKLPSTYQTFTLV